MTGIMQGPNVDFMLGRLWETTTESALKKVYETDGTKNPSVIWDMKAQQEFQTKTAGLL